MIPVSNSAYKAANDRCIEVLTDLRLKEGGGFKVASQNRRALRAALEAAAPHMASAPISAVDIEAVAQMIQVAKRDGWDEGAEAAWERSTPEVNGAHYMWRSEGDPVNPYRTTK